MFLSLLSGRYPFFKPVDDLESLAQLVALFGTDKLKQVARTCGERLALSFALCWIYSRDSNAIPFSRVGADPNQISIRISEISTT